MVAPSEHRTSESSHRWVLVALPVGIGVVVVWPLQALAIAMLATTALMLVSVYAVFAEHAIPNRLRPRLDRPVLVGVGAALVVGIVLTMFRPTTATPTAFVLLVLACGVWLLSEWLLGRHEHRRSGRDHRRSGRDQLT